MALLLDASVFIEAHKRYYARDICPGFWECLSHHCTENSLASIDKVRDEIKIGGDALWGWVKDDAPKALFLPSDEQSVVEVYSEVMDWVQRQQFTNVAKVDFARGADGWLIAYAKVHEMMLVTDEKPDLNARKRVPIPNVCDQFGVDYENTYAMLRELEAEFKWAP